MVYFREINSLILKRAPKHRAANNAPSTFADLIAGPRAELVVWNGASETTIFGDPKVNYAFRALHDALHIETLIGFTVEEEIYLGKLQASKYDGLFADLIYCEVSLQAEYYAKTGEFVSNQVEFTLSYLRNCGYKL